MRTIAVFHVADTVTDLWYCELEDLIGRPSRGDEVIHEHKLYEIAKMYLILGVRDERGQLRSGLTKLLEVLNTLFGKQKALLLYSNLRNVGSGDTPDSTSSGILLPKHTLSDPIGEFDNVIFCSVKSVRAAGNSRFFPDLLNAAQKLSSGAFNGEVGRKRKRSSVAAPQSIRLTEADRSGDKTTKEIDHD